MEDAEGEGEEERNVHSGTILPAENNDVLSLSICKVISRMLF